MQLVSEEYVCCRAPMGHTSVSGQHNVWYVWRTYQEQLVHYLCVKLQLIDSLPNILLPDEMDTLLSHDSVTLALRLLGAPLDPIRTVLPNYFVAQ